MTIQEFEFIVQVINNNTYERILFDEITRYAQANGINVCDLPYYEFIHLRNYLDRVHRYRVQNLANATDDYERTSGVHNDPLNTSHSWTNAYAPGTATFIEPEDKERIQERPFIARLKSSNRKAKNTARKERIVTAVIASIFIACALILNSLVINCCMNNGLLILMLLLTLGFFIATVVRLSGMRVSETAIELLKSLPEEAYKTSVAYREALRNTNAAIFAANIHQSQIRSLYKRITK